jgi:hypothetical protein
MVISRYLCNSNEITTAKYERILEEFGSFPPAGS